LGKKGDSYLPHLMGVFLRNALCNYAIVSISLWDRSYFWLFFESSRCG